MIKLIEKIDGLGFLALFYFWFQGIAAVAEIFFTTLPPNDALKQ
jgi:hypothetical protein